MKVLTAGIILLTSATSFAKTVTLNCVEKENGSEVCFYRNVVGSSDSHILYGYNLVMGTTNNISMDNICEKISGKDFEFSRIDSWIEEIDLACVLR